MLQNATTTPATKYAADLPLIQAGQPITVPHNLRTTDIASVTVLTQNAGGWTVIPAPFTWQVLGPEELTVTFSTQPQNPFGNRVIVVG